MRLIEILSEDSVNPKTIKIEILSSWTTDLLKVLRLLGFPIIDVRKSQNNIEEILIDNKFSTSFEKLEQQIRDRLNYNGKLRLRTYEN